MKDKRLGRQQLEDKFANVWQLTELLSWLIRIEQTDDGPAGFLDYHEIKTGCRTGKRWRVKILGRQTAYWILLLANIAGPGLTLKLTPKTGSISTWTVWSQACTVPVREHYHELKIHPDFDGNKREPFNPHLTEHYTELLKKCLSGKSNHLRVVWQLRQVHQRDELELDGRPLTFAPLFSRKSQFTEDVETLDENELGLTGLLYMIAESKLFGDPSQVDRTGYIDTLTALLYWKQQADKIKKP